MINYINKYLLMILLSVLVGCNGGVRSTSPDAKAAEINMRLGLNYFQIGDYKVALEKLEKSLKQDPSLPSTHNTIALLYQRLGEIDKAEKHFKKAIFLAPKYSEAQNNYGVFLCQQQRYDESEKYFLAAIKNPLYDRAAEAYENAGVCMYRNLDSIRAEAYFRKALAFNPKLSKSLINMADIRYEENDYLSARAYVQRYHAVSQWAPRALLIAIKVEIKLNDQSAVASYTLLLKAKFPDSKETQQLKRGQF